MQIDLLRPERQRLAALAERYHLHSQCLAVERTGYLDVFHGQNQMVHGNDFHGVISGARRAIIVPAMIAALM